MAARSAATAVVAEEARRLATGGTSGAPGVLDVDLACYRLGRQQHPVGDPGGAGHDGAQAQPGVDQGVVGRPI